MAGPTQALRQDEASFVGEITRLMAPWGFAPSVGRVYGYLLLRQRPAGLDEMASALGLSRAAVWNAGRALETFEHVQRSSVAGSKRILYAISGNMAAPVQRQVQLLAALADLSESCAADVADPHASPLLAVRARFYRALHKALQGAIDDLS